MKILFGIQTTGNGHLSRAQEIVPELLKMGELTLLLSGEPKKVTLPCNHQIQRTGLTYTFGDNGRISIPKTVQNIQLARFFKDVNELDLSKYDLILNDFEPISAWAAKFQNRKSFSLSHQSSFLSNNTPRPKKQNRWVELLMRQFAPTSDGIGFHFKRYDKFILPPVIKSSIQQLEIKTTNHFTVYLPSYHPDLLVQVFNKHKDAEWHIFSPQVSSKRRSANVLVQPISKKHFVTSLCSSQGVVTAGGFELCAETLYLGKKLFSIPIKNQYEQVCNSEALRQMGVQTSKDIGPQFDVKISKWMDQTKLITLDEIATTDEIFNHIHRFIGQEQHQTMVA